MLSIGKYESAQMSALKQSKSIQIVNEYLYLLPTWHFVVVNHCACSHGIFGNYYHLNQHLLSLNNCV